MFSALFWGTHPGPQLIDGLCVVAMVSDVGLGCRNLGGVGGEDLDLFFEVGKFWAGKMSSKFDISFF